MVSAAAVALWMVPRWLHPRGIEAMARNLLRSNAPPLRANAAWRGEQAGLLTLWAREIVFSPDDGTQLLIPLGDIVAVDTSMSVDTVSERTMRDRYSRPQLTVGWRRGDDRDACTWRVPDADGWATAIRDAIALRPPS